MNWIAYSSLMFFGSVALYLVVRKSSLLKIPAKLTNLAMFAIPLIVFMLIGAGSQESLGLSLWHGIILIIASVIFAYGGNVASLKSISIAPNPGYSLVLSKSYVLFTTIVAVLLLNADISLRNIVAILMIVIFSGMIMISKKGSKNVEGSGWITLSFGAFFAWGLLSLTSKYLFNNGLPTIAFLVYLYSIVTLCIIIFNKIKKSSFEKLQKQEWLLLLATGIFSTLFNYGQFQAIKLAPNVGYVNAINASSISLVTVLAVLLFKDELTLKKGIGVAGVSAGLLLLVL